MTLSAGVRLGPYEVLGLLGAGGMGEVYRARDPRLGREVAIKVLPEAVARDADRLLRFEREARAVAALNHPNILTVFDVGTHGPIADAAGEGASPPAGVPYVVTELLEGETLREHVSRHSASRQQVLSLAVQAAQGLDAAHAKGIVHRDLKPENLFVTTDGRVKILDFGLAKLVGQEAGASVEETESSPTGAGQVLGTVGYMSPEQVRALPVDHRTDIFSLGVVLYELLSGKHPFRRETAIGTLTAILEETPAELSSLGRGIPPSLSGIVKRCLEKDRGQRFRSAHDLGLALESVLAAPTGSAALQETGERDPYPGLLSFTEEDAGLFFGREAEVGALWGRLRNRRLLAVIAPSGAGKTSLVRAGVVASRPEGWAALVCTPGSAPLRELGQALAPELSGDHDALRKLVGFEDAETAYELVARWRRAHAEALVVVDQFEELFTLNPPATQERFATLLGRLTRDGDVHVLLSMRDDFLIRCSEQESLSGVFLELTPLPALSREGLSRALVEPAKRRGFRFEDEGLVEEMVGSVEGARGALPLLAFAVSRLWERRDREKKLLTRAAYEEVGGVAGALAQHAEATMDRVGTERPAVVREVFRNLVTAHGTRAVAEREELLSMFPDRRVAEEVLAELIDARLLTSYEVEGKEGEPSRHRVEIAHESLLKAWPRLVRWQIQDEEGAVLRDQLKQAAHLWEEKGRTSDILWTGTAFAEYELWRGRYTGALTAVEQDFANAMADRSRRQRRRRRAVAAAIVAASLAVATVTGALWRRSEAAREQARAEALRAEAGKLLALARTHLETDRTLALAHVRGSLGLYDTPEARRFVLEVLWRGPVARVLDAKQAAKGLGLPEEAGHFGRPLFSPDGRWMARRSHHVLVFDRNGGPPRALPPQPDTTATIHGFGSRSDLLVAPGPGHSVRLWSLPDLREVRVVSLGPGQGSYGIVRGEKVVAWTTLPGGESVFQSLELPDGRPAVVTAPSRGEVFWEGTDAGGNHAVVSRSRSVGLRTLDGTDRLRIVGRTREDVYYAACTAKGDLVASTDGAGAARIWSTAPERTEPLRVFPGNGYAGNSFALFDPQGRRLSQVGPNGTHTLWDLESFPDTRPLVVGRPGPSGWRQGAFDPSGRWLALGDEGRTTVEFWPVGGPRRRVLPGHAAAYSMAFTPDSRWLATCPYSRTVRLWPSALGDGSARGLDSLAYCASLAVHPTGRSLIVGTEYGAVVEQPLRGGPTRVLLETWTAVLEKPVTAALASIVALDPAGRRAVAIPHSYFGIREPESQVLAEWELSSRTRRLHSFAHLADSAWAGWWPAFAPDGRLYVGGRGGVLRLTLPPAPGGRISAETIHTAGAAGLDLSRDGKHLLVGSTRDSGRRAPHEDLFLVDPTTGDSRRIATHGARLTAGRLSASGRIIVTGDADGVVRVGLATGEEPHLLLGHEGPVIGLALSPDERWIASSSDESISIWPVPDVTQSPLHTLPHPEVLAKLDALTNLHVVRDPTSATGWKEEVGPFPGWKDVPTW